MSDLIIKDRELPLNCLHCSFRRKGYLYRYSCPVLEKEFNYEYLMRNGGDKERLCKDIMFTLEGDYGQVQQTQS